MSLYFACLRAFNIGGGRTVKMCTLRQLFESLGFSNVSTFIASENVIFETPKKTAKSLEEKIEKSFGNKKLTFLLLTSPQKVTHIEKSRNIIISSFNNSIRRIR
jgi:uncharacterized protein (DUF1697 family)